MEKNSDYKKYGNLCWDRYAKFCKVTFIFKKSGFVVLQRTSIIIFGANFGKENLYKMVPDTQLKTKIKTTTNNIQRNDRR